MITKLKDLEEALKVQRALVKEQVDLMAFLQQENTRLRVIQNQLKTRIYRERS